jgi:hypothetical protein
MGAVGKRECFWAVLIPERPQPLGHLIERLIPGEALPLICAAFPNTLQRIIEASGVIEVIDKQSATGTKPPAGDRMVWVSFDLNRAVVFDAQAHTTARVAETAIRPASFRHGRMPPPFPESFVQKLATVYCQI